MKISLTEKQKDQLRELGFEEKDMTPETLVNIKMYQEALKGSVSAANAIKNVLNQGSEDKEESIEDLSKEVAAEEHLNQ